MQLWIIAYEHDYHDLSNKHNIPSIHVVMCSEAGLETDSIDPNPSCCKPIPYIAIPICPARQLIKNQ